MLLLIWKARCSKRRCLYFDVLMFPICLFTFQFSNKTRRLCKYITRLFENIIYHKEKYTRSQNYSGLLCNYSFFTLHSELSDGVRCSAQNNLSESIDYSNIKRIRGTYSSRHPWYFRYSCLCNMPAKQHLDLFLLNIGLIWSFKVDVLISTSKRK